MNLIELMISLTLGLLVIFSTSTIYLTAEKNFALQESLRTRQESAHRLKIIFQTELHQAGDVNCEDLMTKIPSFNPVENYTNAKMKKNSDAITIHYSPVCDKIITNHIFIADTGRKTTDHHPIFSIYESFNNQNRALEMVEGVDEMKIYYYENEGSQNIKRNASEVRAWRNIVGVECDIKFLSDDHEWFYFTALTGVVR